MKIAQIAEIQGLYGPITISEKLLQKIWMRGDFNTSGLKTIDGLPLQILTPGTWNLQEGPDFKNAEIEVADQRRFGDVEVHFYRRDWHNHGHDRDTGFDRVVLHVVLFEPGRMEKPPKTTEGNQPHTLVLLPWLHQDIEEYATDEALLALEKRDYLDLIAPFLEKSLTERHSVLREKAYQRWSQKVQYARERLNKLSWAEACHQSCLEVLGYRRNRVPMAALATRFPLSQMAALERSSHYYFRLQKDHWKLAGLRPVNHPRTRLNQYLALLKQNPLWPMTLRDAIGILESCLAPDLTINFPETSEPDLEKGDTLSTAAFRRRVKLKEAQQFVFENILVQTLAGNRLNTLVCDAFLPLLSAVTGHNLFPYWFYWFSGDVPDALSLFLKQIKVTDRRAWPSCNGFNQGALKIFIEGGI